MAPQPDPHAPRPAVDAEVLTIDQVATLLQVHHRVVRKLLRSGTLHGVRVGTLWRIPRAAVDAFLRGERWPAPAPAPTPTPGARDAGAGAGAGEDGRRGGGGGRGGG
jgi:excisionase family DNA binding protein